MANNNNKPLGWKQKRSAVLPLDFSPAKGKINIDLEQFDDFLSQQGTRVCVHRTMFCPNVKSIDGAEHEIDCQVCKGSGFLDVRPVETIAFIQSQDLEKQHNPEGYYDGNSVTATFREGIELQYYTLVTLPDFADIFYERIKRSEGKLDVLKYSAKCVNVLIDETGKEYFAGNDFKLDDLGNLVWKTGKGPDPGAIYSIHYEAAVQFRAIRAMHVNRFIQVRTKDGIQMRKAPEQWLLQKEFLVDRKDRDGNRLAPNKLRDSDLDYGEDDE